MNATRNFYFMGGKTVKVRVIKSSGEGYWYKNKIGEVFDVRDLGSEDYEVLPYGEFANLLSHFLAKDDCVIVGDKRNPQAGEIWKHYKGGEYLVNGIDTDEETGELRVSYQALYAPYRRWSRKLSVWMENVNDGTPRFSRLDLFQ